MSRGRRLSSPGEVDAKPRWWWVCTTCAKVLCHVAGRRSGDRATTYRELLRISIVSKKERRGGSTCYGIAEGLFACLARLPAFDASFRLIAKTTSSSERGRHWGGVIIACWKSWNWKWPWLREHGQFCYELPPRNAGPLNLPWPHRGRHRQVRRAPYRVPPRRPAVRRHLCPARRCHPTWGRKNTEPLMLSLLRCLQTRGIDPLFEVTCSVSLTGFPQHIILQNAWRKLCRPGADIVSEDPQPVLKRYGLSDALPSLQGAAPCSRGRERCDGAFSSPMVATIRAVMVKVCARIRGLASPQFVPPFGTFTN